MNKYVLGFFFLMVVQLNAQNRDKVWMLGFYANQNMGISFDNGSVDTFSLIRDLGFFITNASICDTAGNLLFYTNGQLLYNRFHQPMLNSSNFNPGTATFDPGLYPYGLNIEQGVLVLPHPDSSNLYDLFHISSEYFPAYNVNQAQPLNLMHTVIDMNLDSGKGGITSIKNEVIISDTLSHGGL
ncbi:MAG: hypothetical protein RIQ89_933, partial [Bacteroidota bacterium]